MEIVDKRSNIANVEFDKLAAGDVFILNEDGHGEGIFPYIKIRDGLNNSKGFTINAIGLFDGYRYSLQLTAEVKRVNCRLEIID